MVFIQSSISPQESFVYHFMLFCKGVQKFIIIKKSLAGEN